MVDIAVTTPFGPATKMGGYVPRLGEARVLVYFCVADREYLTFEMRGPGRYMVLPITSVFEIDQGESHGSRTNTVPSK